MNYTYWRKILAWVGFFSIFLIPYMLYFIVDQTVQIQSQTSTNKVLYQELADVYQQLINKK